MQIPLIFEIGVLIFSVVIHEVSHGYAALMQGDGTAKYEGRLTLNPIKHLDFFGSFVVPVITSMAGVPFGWAKPVPYNPYNLRNQRFGPALVALAGPLSNFFIATVFAIVVRVGISMEVSAGVLFLSAAIVKVNVALGVFNLLPIPPLDGSKVFFSFLPYRYAPLIDKFERYSLFVIFALLVFGSKFLGGLIYWVLALFL